MSDIKDQGSITLSDRGVYLRVPLCKVRMTVAGYDKVFWKKRYLNWFISLLQFIVVGFLIIIA